MNIQKKVEEIEESVNNHSLAYEIMLELKKTIKRQWITIWLLIGLLAASNIYWLFTFSQYGFASYEQNIGGEGHASFVGRDGDISNGEAENKNEN